MNKKLSNFILYFSIALFAMHCAGSQSSEIINSKQDNNNTVRESQQYVDGILLESKQNAEEDITFNNENVLITDLQSELHVNKAEIQKLRSIVKNLEKQLEEMDENRSSETLSEPLLIYNQEILMESGTVYYGNIVYQDEQMVTIETMIGKLNLDRTKIIRVISHKTDALSEVDETPVFEGLDEFPEIEDGSVIYKKPAEIILLGNISSSTDESGNMRLIGKVKNAGGRRADFVKLNITLYRDWSKSLTPKTFAIFVDGETKYLNPSDSSLVSFSSLSPKAEADFELFVPQNFGTVMSWTYEIDYEEYDYK
tara:strand:- start:4993 stop:5925 length:933 start_codon:yes stop_codon:yes gene_type:complete